MPASTITQALDQHSTDVNWKSNYPVGTTFESAHYTTYGDHKPEVYVVVSEEEHDFEANYDCNTEHYLPVKLIKSPHRDYRLGTPDAYDGFMECHIGKVLSKPLVLDVSAVTDSPWIPTPEEIDSFEADIDSLAEKNSLKPQPRFGWWGDAEA